ncbi:hypothetical protein WMY93_002771 [Mugilogobius chulae]|uniref:Fibronectin type-III domain-containing protein n=1 Tax=Mugilogobius chulae TaxID=88201 RepID=A0AAW0PVH7_9GOBI
MLLLRVLCLPWVLCAVGRLDRCAPSSSYHTASPVLESLQCYNDYQSYFDCRWKEQPGQRSKGNLTLWLAAKRGRTGLCEEYVSAQEGFRQCRYNTTMFSEGTTYTAFFKESVSPCPTGQPTRLQLSRLLKTRPPDNLTISSTEDRDSLITWSNPYPQSSALSNNVTYQLIGGAGGNQKTVGKNRLIPGHRYEARVRARVRDGHWSHWSRTVTWHTQTDPETAPRVDCELWGEQEVQCRWEQSIAMVHFISYQLVCHHNHSTTSSRREQCCENPEMDLEHREGWVTFGCLLKLTQPLTSDLQVELVPKRSTKTFHPSKHSKKLFMGHSFSTSIHTPNTCESDRRGQQLGRTMDTKADGIFKISPRVVLLQPEDGGVKDVCSDSNGWSRSLKGSLSGTILGLDLHPSHTYRVKVRTRVMSPFEGTPSDWSDPVEWTSHKAVWPVSYWIYVSVAVLAAALFFSLVIIPACRRKKLLWVESVPSPGKSKVLLDIQMCPCGPPGAPSPGRVRSEDRRRGGGGGCGRGIWSCDNLPVSPLDKSSMSFSGPYILCQPAASKPQPLQDVSALTELSCPDVGRPSTGGLSHLKRATCVCQVIL